MVRTTSKFKRQRPGTNTREFVLNVDPIVFRSKPSKSNDMRSIQVARNVYFYTNKNYRVPASYQNEAKIVGIMYTHIMGLIIKEAQRLMSFWYDNINSYFNRRAHGWHAGGPYSPKLPQRGKVNTIYIANSRQHTGQLRRSITLRSVNIYGAQLYARPVHAKTDNRDYIDILMRGASGGPRAYSPRLDLRLKGGIWKGIPSSYWQNWQFRFMREIRRSEARLNTQIEAYVTKMQILTPKQIKAAREGYRSKEFIRVTDEDMKNLRLELGKEKYSINRGLQPTEPERPFEETWAGMKAKYYAKQLENNPLTANLPLPAEINDVIRRRRNFGRSR